MAREASLEDLIRDRLQGYVRRASLLRQIHSNKGARADSWGRWYLIATVALAAVVSTIGFMGTTRIASALTEILGPKMRPSTVEVAYNAAVLAILVVTILGLIFRFEEMRNRHYRSIEVLTDFIRDLEDTIALAEVGGIHLTSEDLHLTRVRYQGILATLPPNTDKEYLRAKASQRTKRGQTSGGNDSTVTGLTADAASSDEVLADVLRRLLLSAPKRGALEAVSDVIGPEAWITGGFVREAVWDALHGYQLATTHGDIDVILFEPGGSAEDDSRLEARLTQSYPGQKWSVKNQARMHTYSGDIAYRSMAEAVSRFPETASSVAARLVGDTVDILAPYGLRDLFALRVRPTPGFNLERYRARLAAKGWSEVWQDLAVDPGLSEDAGGDAAAALQANSARSPEPGSGRTGV